MKATRRLAVVGAIALGATLLAGPAYAGGGGPKVAVDVDCERSHTETRQREGSTSAGEGLAVVVLNDLLNDIQAAWGVQDLDSLTIVDNVNVLSPGANAISCH